MEAPPTVVGPSVRLYHILNRKLLVSAVPYCFASRGNHLYPSSRRVFFQYCLRYNTWTRSTTPLLSSLFSTRPPFFSAENTFYNRNGFSAPDRIGKYSHLLPLPSYCWYILPFLANPSLLPENPVSLLKKCPPDPGR